MSSDTNLLIDFSFDELNQNANNNNNDNNGKNLNNILFTCSTPRQSNVFDSNEENIENYLEKVDNNNNADHDDLFFQKNDNFTENLNQNQQQQVMISNANNNDVSCDLLRSSKIDLDLNSDLNGAGGGDDDNTDADITTNELTNSIYSNLNSNIQYNKFLKQNKQISSNNSNSKLKIDYKMPISQMSNLLKNLRNNFNNENNDVLNFDTNLNNNDNFNYDDDSLILSKYQNYNLNSVIDNLKYQNNTNTNFVGKYLRSNSSSSNNIVNGNHNNNDLKIQLEKEILKRQHCEKQIEELNKKLLNLDEQLAVVTALDRKKELFINKLDKNLNKVMETWKEQETQTQLTLNKLKQDKEIALLNEANCMNRVKFLEDEMRQLNNELINEKVKYQDLQREKASEIQNLKKELSELQKIDFDKTSRLEKLQNQVTVFRDEKDSLEQKILQLTRKSEEEKQKYETQEKEMNSKINALTESNEKITAQYESMQVEYEQLIKEAKMVVQESERQYHQLVENIEMERRAKDALQVEMCVLEEKLENTVNLMKFEHENEVKKLEMGFVEKEKILVDKHKSEFNELNTKYRLDIDSIKIKFKNEMESKIQDYEDKIKTLNRKIDIFETEIKNLNESNKILENDRNTVRQNLKQMFELQMKEAMQLLGLSSAVPTTTPTPVLPPTPNLSSSFSYSQSSTSLTQPPPSQPPTSMQTFPSIASLNLTTNPIISTDNEFKIKNDEYRNLKNVISNNKNESFNNLNSISPINTIINGEKSNLSLATKSYAQPSLTTETITSTEKLVNNENFDVDAAGASIKDLFIKYQIDLINKCYNIDENTDNNTNNRTLPMETPRLSTSLVADNRINSVNSLENTKNNSNKSSLNSINEQVKESQNLLSFDSILKQTQQTYNQEVDRSLKQQQQNTSSILNNSQRTTELRYFIEMLLDRSPNEANKSSNNEKTQEQIKIPQKQEEILAKPNLASSPIVNMRTPPSQTNQVYHNDIDENDISYYYTNNQSNLDRSRKKNVNQSYLSDDDNYGSCNEHRERFLGKNNENFDDIRRNLDFEFNNVTPPSKIPVENIPKLNTNDVKNKQPEKKPVDQHSKVVSASKNDLPKKANIKIQPTSSTKKVLESHSSSSLQQNSQQTHQNIKIKNGLSSSNQSLKDASILSAHNKTQSTNVSTSNLSASNSTTKVTQSKRVWK